MRALFPFRHGSREVDEGACSAGAVAIVDSQVNHCHRPEIDSLRALAVMAVILHHAGVPGIHAGYVGVDVFFVISGYVITNLLARERANSGRIDFAAFYARRVGRILPAVAVLVFATLLASLVVLHGRLAELRVVIQSAHAALLFVANYFFLSETTGYFDSLVKEQPLLHLWSLAVEEQFYLFWPAILALLLFCSSSLRLTAVALALLGSIAIAEIWIRSGVWATSAFYLMPARFWEVGCGACVALIAVRPLRPTIARACFCMAFGILLVSMWVTTWSTFPGLGALASVGSTTVMIWMIHTRSDLGRLGRILRSRPLVYIGLLSYSIYLWHWPPLALYRASVVSPMSWQVGMTLVALASIPAVLSFHFVEQPLRQLSRRASARSCLYAGAGTLAALSLAIVGLLSLCQGNGVGQSAAMLAEQDRTQFASGCHVGMLDDVTELPDQSDCAAPAGKPVRVVVWGDSHAGAWLPFAKLLAAKHDSAVMNYTFDACPPVNTLKGPSIPSLVRADACNEFNAGVLNEIDGSGLEILVIAARWPSYFSSPRESFLDEGRISRRHTEEMRRSIETGLPAILRRVSKHVDRVYLMGSVPELKHTATRCLQRKAELECTMSRAEFEVYTAETRKLLLSAVKDLENVFLLDPATYFCPGQRCKLSLDDTPLYYDSNHLTVSAARGFGKAFIGHPRRFIVAKVPENIYRVDD